MAQQEQNIPSHLYMHREKESVKPKKRSVQQKQNLTSTIRDIFIFHSSNPMELNKSMVVNELNKYKPKCLSCKAITRRVQGLLDEIRTIRRSETHSICDHCKFTSGAKCKRCEYILLKFKSGYQEELEEQRQNFKQWLSKVKELLQDVLSAGQLCKYGKPKTDDVVELEKLLEELYPIKERRQLEINAFPSTTSAKDLAESQDMVREVIQKLRMDGARRYSSDNTLYVSPSKTDYCLCTTFKDRDFSIKTSKELLPKQLTTSRVSLDKAMDKLQTEAFVIQGPKFYDKSKLVAKKTTHTKETKGQVKRHKAEKEAKRPLAEKVAKIPLAEKEGTKTLKKKNVTKTVKIAPPKIKAKSEAKPLSDYHSRRAFDDTSLENVLECGDGKRTKSAQREMIRGLEIVPYHKDYMGKGDDLAEALFFHSKLQFETKTAPPASIIFPTQKANVAEKEKVEEDRSGVVLYKLSDKKFVDNGWTQLPTMKTLRKMNVYKMKPAKSCNWFSQNKRKEIVFYSTGEKLAVIHENGSGFWFYRNGRLALEYCDTPNDAMSKNRIIVFSHEENSKQPKSQNIIACFDYNGNGVVYDSKGNDRLKYNQSEGFLFDSSIGAPGRWKWHTLNDPPDYTLGYEDTLEIPVQELEEMMQQDRERPMVDLSMLAIEYRNYKKEAAAIVNKKFKPLDILMKSMKINDYFSLKVIDQANIQLLFKAGAETLKLNLGMILQNDEVIATEVHEAGAVMTALDRCPPKIHCHTWNFVSFSSRELGVASRSRVLPVKSSKYII